MNENRPTAASLNGARDTSTLQFADGTQAEFFLRGGVCFPSEVAGQARGHLVLVGLDVRRSVLLVFEETPFYQVANQVSESGVITQEGVAGWLSMVWQSYFNRRYFHNAGEHQLDLYRKAARQCAMLEPKPRWRPVRWDHEQEAAGAVWAAVDGERIMLNPGPLSDELGQFRNATGAKMLSHYPAVWALACALLGLELHPWRKSDQPYRGESVAEMDEGFQT